jgi:hypothetical protein
LYESEGINQIDFEAHIIPDRLKGEPMTQLGRDEISAWRSRLVIDQIINDIAGY